MPAISSTARRGAIILALTALVASPLGAQAPAALRLGDVLRIVRERHPALAAAGARRRVTVAVARQDAAWLAPSLEWRRENLGSPLAADAFVTVTQPLDLTGRRLALRRAAGAVGRRALSDSVTVARDVELEAARAFWRASLARALADLAAEQRTDAERLAVAESRRAREGALAELAAMRAGLEAERARLAEASARAEWARAGAELSRVLGVDADALPPVAPLEPAGLDSLAAPVDFATAESRALARRSELAAWAAAEDGARLRASATRWGVVGDAAVQVGSKWTAGYATRVVGVVLPVPLFAHGWSRAAADGELWQVRAERRLAEAGVRAEVRGAVDGYRALLADGACDAPAVARRAAEVAHIAGQAYAAGGASLLELLDARRARVETLTAVLRWTADLRLAELELARATGDFPTDLPETR